VCFASRAAILSKFAPDSDKMGVSSFGARPRL
jgi:hypothetical protein